MSTRLVDLSHVLEDGMITYRGLPAPVVCDYLSHEASRAQYGEDTEFHIGEIRMVSNTGTYLDTPFHRFRDGDDLAQLPLERVADVPGLHLRADPERRSIDLDAVDGLDVGGKAVLIETGWSRHWGTERYFEGHPFLTGAAARYLRDAGARLVGIDSLNVDDTDDPTRPVHTVLLGAGIPVVEHLRGLDALRGTSFRFTAVPVKVRGMGTFPVRAFATVVG